MISTAAEIVPSELLVPPDARARGFQRHDAALILDGYLRRLARQDARCRVVLGRLAHGFLARRGQHILGFARLEDYARERLGLSAREVESLASVSARAESLPEIGAAFARGELSWAQVRLLVTVALPENEAEWLARARGRTVRALAALIRATGRADASEEEGDGDEPCVRFRLRCPRRLVRLWGAVVELARRMAGAELTQGQAAEAVAAEGLSARAPAEPLPTAGLWERGEDPADPEETRASFAELDWTAVFEAIPEDVEGLVIGCEDLDPFSLDERMREAVRARQRIDWQMGRLLRVFLDRRLYRLMLFPSAARYVRERLGCSARKVRALVALERKSWQAPGLGEAYRAGELSWVRALSVLPVIAEETAAAWITRAGAVTVRRLADEVEWALAAGESSQPVGPPPPGTALRLAERQMCAAPGEEQADAQITFVAPASVAALFRMSVLTFTGPAEPLWRGFERLLTHVQAEWKAQPRHRDPIFARDGWRCAVPACSGRRNLHDHHILFRSRGGGNARANRVTVCAWHHLRGIHDGRVRVWGEAPDGITWELGVRPGCEPLLRLEGDRYVSRN